MVVDPDGGQVGTLGGGCVEAEVKQKAIRQLGRAGAELQSFVLDHDYAWADGLICGGKMVILTEALRGRRSRSAYFRALHRLLEAGRGFTEAVVVDPERLDGLRPSAARFLFDPDGDAPARAGRPARSADGLAEQDRAARRPAQAGGAGGRRLAADPARESGW